MAYVGAVYRWDVFRADLEPAVGGEQKGDARPVVIVSNDPANRHFSTVTVVPFTSLEGKGRKPHPFEVELPTGIIEDGVTELALPHQVRTIDRMRLLERMGRIEDLAVQVLLEDRLLDHLGIDLEEE